MLWHSSLLGAASDLVNITPLEECLKTSVKAAVPSCYQVNRAIDITNATPKQFLDPHPNFEKKNEASGRFFIFFIILSALKNRTVLKETFNTFVFFVFFFFGGGGGAKMLARKIAPKIFTFFQAFFSFIGK